MRGIDNFYLQQPEPLRSCLLALRGIILAYDPEIENVLKYGMPFFCYRGKMLCYLWIHKKSKLPYVGFVDGNKLDHPELLLEKRARMKVLLIDPQLDLPIHTITHLLGLAIELQKQKIQ